MPVSPEYRMLALAAFAFFFLAVLLAPPLLSEPTATPMHLYGSLGLFLLARALPLLFYRDSFGWFHPLVFSSLMTLMMQSSRLGMYAFGLDWHRALPERTPSELTSLVSYELFLAAIGTLTYYLGFAAARRIRGVRVEATFRTSPERIQWTAGLFTLIGAFAFLQYQGGVVEHLLSFGTGRGAALAGSHYALLVYVPGLAAGWLWLARSPAALKRPAIWVWSLTCLALVFLMSGSRGTLVYYASIGLIVVMIARQRITLIRIGVFVLIAVYVITVLGEIRRATREGVVDFGVVLERPFAETVESGWSGEIAARRTSNSGALPILAEVPDRVDLLYGESYLAFLTLPVPRAFWEDKPGLVGGRVGRTFYGVAGGIPPGAIGEAYWNFHVPGVLLVFFLFGVFHRWLGETFVKSRGDPVTTVLYAVTLVLFPTPYTGAIVAFGFALVPLLIVLKLSTRRLSWKRA